MAVKLNLDKSKHWLFYPNFWTRNPRKPIKGSQDLDFSL